MKKLFFTGLLILELVGCAAFNKKNANNALDAAQLACVFNSTVTNESALAKACDIAQDLIPVVRKLVAQRVAAQQVGVKWDEKAK